MSHEKDMKISALLDFYSPLFSDAEIESADMYFNQDLSLSEISEITGISRNGVRLRLEKVKKELKEYENALGLYSEYRKNIALFDRAEEIAISHLEGKNKDEMLNILKKLRNGGDE